MDMNNDCFTKSERRELRSLAGLAYERELTKALGALEEGFGQWRENKINAFELNELIHKFHNGVARDLWSCYEVGDVKLNVKYAIVRGIILKNEISSGLFEKLNVIV